MINNVFKKKSMICIMLYEFSKFINIGYIITIFALFYHIFSKYHVIKESIIVEFVSFCVNCNLV